TRPIVGFGSKPIRADKEYVFGLRQSALHELRDDVPQAYLPPVEPYVEASFLKVRRKLADPSLMLGAIPGVADKGTAHLNHHARIEGSWMPDHSSLCRSSNPNGSIPGGRGDTGQDPLGVPAGAVGSPPRLPVRLHSFGTG